MEPPPGAIRIIIGRHPGCDFVLADDSVSREHAELTYSPDGSIFVRDCGSANGTSILRGGRAEPLKEAHVKMSDILQVGDLEIPVSMIVEELQRKHPELLGGQPLAEAPSPSRSRSSPPGGKRAALALGGVVVLLLAVVLVPMAWRYLQDEKAYAAASQDSGLDKVEEYLKDFHQGRHLAQVLILKDDRSFEAAQKTADTLTKPIDDYLAGFPEGRHRLEAQDLRDDRRYNKLMADFKASPKADLLRDYLADKQNQRHRSQVQASINKLYDAAIARLREKAKQLTDRGMFTAVVALLESLKQAPTPAVYVSFHSSCEATPQGASAKAEEAQVLGLYIERFPQLNGSSIVEVGGTFSPEQVKRREGVIMERLKASFHDLLNSDLVDLKPLEKGEEASLEISYHTSPTGRLYAYSSGSSGTVKSLVRGYHIKWEITIRPEGGHPFKQTLTSEALTSLRMHFEDGDPNWAPYAVLMYSAFYDFSGRLVKSFGMKAPQAPNVFSFKEAIGHESEESNHR